MAAPSSLMRTIARAIERDRLNAQIRAIRVAVAVNVAVLAVVAVGLVWLNVSFGIGYGELTHDPATLTGSPVHFGALSHAGVLIWIAGAAVALFAGSLARAGRGRSGPGRLLTALGLLSLVLAIDDLYLLHEVVLPRLGVPETVVVLGYAVASAAIVIDRREDIVETDYLLAAAASGLFALSVALDLFAPRIALKGLFEDGAKLGGILFWTAYLVRTARAVVRH